MIQIGTRFSTTQRVRVDWCAVGQFPLELAILGPSVTASCDSVQIYSDFVHSVTCDTASTTATLLPGDYYLYISQFGYSYVYCGQEYRAWITHTPGSTDTVRDVAIWRIGEDIVLRWTADSSFTGTYTIYQSDEDVPFPGADWSVCASGIIPMLGHQHTVHAIENALLTGERKYYLVVSDYPY